MTENRADNGMNPNRDHRRAGEGQDYVLGADGKPLLDRYGRPVVRRAGRTGQSAGQSSGRPAARPIPRRVPPLQSQNPTPRPPIQQRPIQQRPIQQPVQPTNVQPQRPAQRPTGSFPPGQQPPAYRQTPQPGYRPTPGGNGAPAGGAASASVQPAAQPQYRTVQPAARPHRRAKKANPAKVIAGWLALLLAAIMALTLAFALWTDSRLTRTDALAYDHVANTAGTNWLLVGSDSRVGLSEEEQAKLGTGGDVGAGRTDTIMLLHIPRSGKATLVSIPRDSYVEIPGFGMDKINAAFTYGGAPLLGQTIEQWSGLRIDHYAEIGMGGLANVVDAVGGVEMCLAEPIADPLAGIDLPAGCQNLQGPDALGYVRTRATAMGDLDRVQRQREFFASLLNKITSPATLVNPFRTISLVNHTAQSFTVGEGDHVWNLGRVALAMGKGVETKTVPLDGFADTGVGNVVLWNDAETAALWESLK